MDHRKHAIDLCWDFGEDVAPNLGSPEIVIQFFLPKRPNESGGGGEAVLQHTSTARQGNTINLCQLKEARAGQRHDTCSTRNSKQRSSEVVLQAKRRYTQIMD